MGVRQLLRASLVFLGTVSLVLLQTGCHRKHHPNKRFAIIIPSYNNEQYAEWNLKSALDQEYDNFHIVYINDCSKDRTIDVVKRVVKESGKEHMVTVIDNETRCGALKNIYTAIHNYTDDNDIVVTLDGDDALADERVLSYLNKLYSSKKREVWLTYGQYREKESGQLGFCTPIPKEVIKNKTFRKHSHIPSHLRTFYSWLFKEIKKDDLMYKGNFFEMTWDIAFMVPMIEMARDHFQFVNKVLYIYNDYNPISDHRVNQSLQKFLDFYIRNLDEYEPLTHKPETYALAAQE
ncbi:MAG: hypothetical protein S4CHLAM102_06320 [Chlamydiia bacterium]|nr:hypothetical protein [Chlamydiia bacterium]